MEKIKRGCLFIVCCLLAVALPAQTLSEQDIIKKMASAAEKTRTVRADFTQTKYSKMLKNAQTSQGKLFCELPDKLRWEASPQGSPQDPPPSPPRGRVLTPSKSPRGETCSRERLFPSGEMERGLASPRGGLEGVLGKLEGGSCSLPLPTAGFTYRLTSRIFKLFFRCYNSLKITGAENIPAEGACILAPNHQSFIDGPLVLSALPWNKLGEYFFYATEEHVRGRRRRLAAKSNVIVMERADLKNSILKLAKVLREGHRVIIFPEGARTHDGQTVPFKKTFAILAKDLEVPIVPVCIRGAYEALPRGSRFVSPKHIEVTFLPAINGARSREQGAGELSYEELTKQTQHAIEAHLAR